MSHLTNEEIYHELDKYVAKCTELSTHELDVFHAALTFKSFPKKTYLLKAGEVCNFEAYVIQGCARVFYLNSKGAEVDLFFAVEDWWLSDLASFSQQKPSSLYIQTLEECNMLLITHHEKEKLFKKVPNLERMFRLMVQRAYETMTNRLIATISQPAEARYTAFLMQYPTISQRVPQHLIAAYLGITPEFLSKLRSKHLKAH